MSKYIIMIGLLLLVGSAMAEDADMGLYMASFNLDEEHSTEGTCSIKCCDLPE
jgi:hypothetical protein